MVAPVRKVTISLLSVAKCNSVVSNRCTQRLKSYARANPLQYCMDLVRKRDYENYLCTLMLPKEARSAAFAVRALNIETMQIRDIVSEKTTGLMRLQFWRDTIDRIYAGSVPASPIAIAISKAVDRHGLSKHWFQRLLEGREQNLQDRAFSSLDHVESYAESTTSSLSYLVLESLDVKDVHADHAASHLGKCQGLITLVRGIPVNASMQRVYIPVELMIKHNISQEEVVRGCREQKMKDLVFEILSSANTHLELSRSFIDKVPIAAKSALLSAVCCDSYLKAIQRIDFDVFDGLSQKKDTMLPFKIWTHSIRKKY